MPIQVSEERSHIKIESENAVVTFVVGRQRYPGTSIWYDVRLAQFYAQADEKKPRAQKEVARKLLCFGLHHLISHPELSIDESSVLCLEASSAYGADLYADVRKKPGAWIKELKERNMLRHMPKDLLQQLQQRTTTTDGLVELNDDELYIIQEAADMELMQKVYEPMGFEVKSAEDGFMTSGIGDLIGWCSRGRKL